MQSDSSSLPHILHCDLNVPNFLFFWELFFYFIIVSTVSEGIKRLIRRYEAELWWSNKANVLIQTWFYHMSRISKISRALSTQKIIHFWQLSSKLFFFPPSFYCSYIREMLCKLSTCLYSCTCVRWFASTHLCVLNSFEHFGNVFNRYPSTEETLH